MLQKYQEQLLAEMQKAQHANEAKTEFLRRMSHDIRTPINGIQGMIHMAERFPDDMEKQDFYREKVLVSSNFLLDLVNDVLDMRKLVNVIGSPLHVRQVLLNIGGIDKNAALNVDNSIYKNESLSLEKVHVLLVEDNDINMEISEFILTEAGATVTKAWNGQEAVEQFAQSKPGMAFPIHVHFIS